MTAKSKAQKRYKARYRLAAGALALLLCVAAKGSWKTHVPESYRRKVNPYAGQADAIAGGKRLFSDHCAQCHQPDALGRGKRPSLRSSFVQSSTDGELFWVLRNGILSHGMPSWSMLPEPSRWQIIAYVKSLGPVDFPQHAPTASTPRNSSESDRRNSE
jgi:mono/diheme cytochrome c family protein